MTRVLDIDMDFFLNDIAHWINDDNRLSESLYIPWTESSFRSFLEDRCLLSKTNRIKGRVIKNHNEAFFFWDELISSGEITTPLEVTHVDAHSDTGLGDNGYVYIAKELMNYHIKERRERLNTRKVFMSNYLSYAMACGWVNKVNFVLHDLWDNDLMHFHLKDFKTESGNFQFKAYSKSIDVGLQFDRIVDGKIKPQHLDPVIPFNLTPWQDFNTKSQYDLLVFCQSPGYTPKTADFMMDIIKEYITEI